MRKRKQKRKMPLGITLPEVLAAIVILSIVLLISIPNLKSGVDNVKGEGDKANLQLIDGAAKQFRLDTGIIPGDLGYLLSNPDGGIPGWDGPYLKELPQSPSGKSYEIDSVTGKVYLK